MTTCSHTHLCLDYTSPLETVYNVNEVFIVIHYFAVENFRSICDENILAFDENSTAFPAHPTIGITGANASGKTNFLHALTFCLWFMQESFRELDKDDLIPLDEPFITRSGDPTKFHVIFSLAKGNGERTIYEYQLVVTTKEVIKEVLHIAPDDDPQLVYMRSGNDVELGKGELIPMGDKTIFLRDLRENCSIISYAANYPTQAHALACKNLPFFTNVNILGLSEIKFDEQLFWMLVGNEQLYEHTLRILELADVGIESFAMKPQQELIASRLERIQGDSERKYRLQRRLLADAYTPEGPSFFRAMPVFQHRLRGQLSELDKHHQSSGTLQLLATLSHILGAFRVGAILIVDELELKLHQDLVAYLLGLFQNEDENVGQGQLIFSFHNSSLIQMLEPEQLWFAEKGDDGATQLFAASHFNDIEKLHERDLEALYRIGRFGATPRGI